MTGILHQMNHSKQVLATGLLSLGALMLGASPGAVAQHDVPDFSGVWQTFREPGQGGRASGFGAPSARLPYTEEGRRRADEFQQLVAPFQDNAATYCVPYGMPTMMEMVAGYPLEIIQRPEQITIIFEIEGETRRVYIDDKAYPVNRRFPNRQGYSAGHWEGGTLVVETTSLTDGQDQRSYPHSDQATIKERFSMETRDTGLRIINYEMTLTDPVYYTAPVTYTASWQPLPDGQILAYNCTEEPWFKLLEMRRAQLRAGEPVTATMADVYATRMYEAAAEGEGQ